MGFSGSISKAEIIRFWRYPARIASLLLVMAAGLFMGQGRSDWEVAGNTFQWAATVAGILTCSWSAAAIMEDRDSNRLEAIIASGWRVWRYLAAKILTVGSLLAVSGIVLAIIGFAFRIASVGGSSFLPYVAGFSIIYLPIVVVALGFGMCFGTLTRNRPLAILLFSFLWITGLFWISPEWHLFDVTGESLNLAFFQPVPTKDDAVFEGLASGFAETIIAEKQVSHDHSLYNPLFLGAVVLLTFGSVSFWLMRKWNVDASALVSDARLSLQVPVPQRLLELKAMGFLKLLILMFAVLAMGLLMFMPIDTKDFGFLLMEFLTPICFAMAYAGIYPSDMRAEVCESQLSLPHYAKPHVRRIVLICCVAVFTLFFQAYSFAAIMELDVLSSVIRGAVPTLFLGGFAYCMGIITGSESTSSTIAIVVWMGLYLSGIYGIVSRYWLDFVAALTASLGLPFDAVFTGSVLPAMAGIALFLVGLALLGKPERLIAGRIR